MQRDIKTIVEHILKDNHEEVPEYEMGVLLGQTIHVLRLRTRHLLRHRQCGKQFAGHGLKIFKRIFYQKETGRNSTSPFKRHKDRFETTLHSPERIQQKATGVFRHAHFTGNSILNPSWIDDFGEFMAGTCSCETSSTTGGLDSLLQPTDFTKKRRNFAARAFGSAYLLRPVALHPTNRAWALVEPVTWCSSTGTPPSRTTMAWCWQAPRHRLDSTRCKYSMYGAVPLSKSPAGCIPLKRGRLAHVKMLILNCTFDGLVYNVEKVMEKCCHQTGHDLPMGRGLVWLRGLHPYLPARSAMYVANKLCKIQNRRVQKEQYKRHLAELKGRVAILCPRCPTRSW